MTEERIERLEKEEESRVFLMENGLYTHLFGKGIYRYITNKDLQNYGEDIRYYTDLYNYESVDEKEYFGNKDYVAFKVSGIGGVMGLTERCFVSQRQQNNYWFYFRRITVGEEIASAEGYLLDVKALREAVVKNTGRSLDDIFRMSNYLRNHTNNERTMKLSSNSEIKLYCNKKVDEEYVEIRIPKDFTETICKERIVIKKGGEVINKKEG